MSEPTGKCELCGEPMPPGEEMFRYHGYSCDCPKPPLPRPDPAQTLTDEILKLMLPFQATISLDRERELRKELYEIVANGLKP
jgi:hypothetical protein